MAETSPSSAGVTGVTRSEAALLAPAGRHGDWDLRYGLGIPFQVAPRKAALFCNIRRLGVPCIDFEAGADVIAFDDLSRIGAEQAVPVARDHEEEHPRTGRPLVMVKHVLLGGFVPLGAHLADGRPHPHGGTGFALGPTIGFPADLSERLAGQKAESHRYLELHQLAYDGAGFRVTGRQRLAFDGLLEGWRIVNRGLGAAIPDGADLLWGLVAAAPGEEARSGLSRWRRGDDGWRCVSFLPVTPKDTSMEPSLHRDLDGSLLMGARCASHDKGDAVSFGIRVWQSPDGGQSWRQVISAARTRASTPVILNQAADGTPYVTANPYRDAVHDDGGRKVGVWSHRQQVWLWPLNPARTGLQEPITVRDTADFGPPRPGRLWYADHPIAGTVQLADGAWRNLLAYRVRESQPTREDCEEGTAFTGCYVEEVRSAGPARPAWLF